MSLSEDTIKGRMTRPSDPTGHIVALVESTTIPPTCETIQGALLHAKPSVMGDKLGHADDPLPV